MSELKVLFSVCTSDSDANLAFFKSRQITLALMYTDKATLT